MERGCMTSGIGCCGADPCDQLPDVVALTCPFEAA
jgi:hypothetical protein